MGFFKTFRPVVLKGETWHDKLPTSIKILSWAGIGKLLGVLSPAIAGWFASILPAGLEDKPWAAWVYAWWWALAVVGCIYMFLATYTPLAEPRYIPTEDHLLHESVKVHLKNNKDYRPENLAAFVRAKYNQTLEEYMWSDH